MLTMTQEADAYIFVDVLDSGGTLTFELPKIRVLMGERAAGGGPSSPRVVQTEV